MKKRPYGKVLPHRHLTEQETKLVEFCRAQGIDIGMGFLAGGRGRHTYHITFHPKFLDKTEKHVVDLCEKQGINYTFTRDVDGFHHYEFDKFVEQPDNKGGGEYIIDLSKIRNDRGSFFVLPDPPEVEEVKPDLPRLNWWRKALYYCVPSYKSHHDKKVVQTEEKAKKETERLKAEARVVKERKDQLELLILAGLKTRKEAQREMETA